MAEVCRCSEIVDSCFLNLAHDTDVVHSTMIDQIVVLASRWPSGDSGDGIANRSSLRAYKQVAQSVYFVGITPRREYADWVENDKRDTKGTGSSGSVQFKHVPIPKRKPAVRFLWSLGRDTPAICVEFQDRSVQQQLLGLFRQNIDLSQEPIPVIFEDLPIAVLLPWVRRQSQNVRCIIRSHNVLVEAFENIPDSKGPALGLAWKYELSRIRRFEEKMARTADALWAISDHDAEQYNQRYGVNVAGKLKVKFGKNEVRNLGPSSLKNIVYVGTADLRKGHGLSWFIDNVWQNVKKELPEVKLCMAGRGTDEFNSVAQDVSGIGYVDDDQAFMKKGQIFINPQHHGSGVQIKSIVAMLANRTLVSTSTGVAGIGGHPGENYVVADSGHKMSDKIVSLIRQPERALQIAESGRAYARKNFQGGDNVEGIRNTLHRIIK